jgi:hypothetical protein
MTTPMIPHRGTLVSRLLVPITLLFIGAAGPEVDPVAWKRLVSFRPPEEIQRTVIARGSDWAVHRIEDASGRISLDSYTILIDKLPRIDGRDLSAEEFLVYLRKHFNAFADPSMAAFDPLTEADRRLWNSDDPTGAILLIDMKLAGTSPDSGCVVVSAASRDEWIFSTVRAGAPGVGALLRRDIAAAHPVSGNRAFGWSRLADGRYLLYTTAADRPTRKVDAVAADRVVFPGADRLWRGFQARLVGFVNGHGGRAEVGPVSARRFDWATIRDSDAYDVSDQPKWVPIGRR